MSDKSEMYEALKRALENYKLEFPRGTFVISAQDWANSKQAQMPKFETGEMHQFTTASADNPVVVSNLVKPGYGYFIEKAEPDYEPISRAIGERLNELFWHQAFTGRFTATDWAYERWERRPGETLIIWGIRLDRLGALDDPQKRWVYQKAVFAALLSPIRWIMQRIRKVHTA